MTLRVTVNQTAEQAARVKPDIPAIEQQYGLPTGPLAAVSHVESNDNPNTRPSSAGAIGQFQIMPAVARNLGVDPSDPMQAAHGAATLLKQAYDANGGDVARTAMTYHGGPNTALWGPKTRAYAEKIASAMDGGPTADTSSNSFLRHVGADRTAYKPMSDIRDAPSNSFLARVGAYDPFEDAFAGKAPAPSMTQHARAEVIDASDPFEVAFAGGMKSVNVGGVQRPALPTRRSQSAILTRSSLTSRTKPARSIDWHRGARGVVGNA